MYRVGKSVLADDDLKIIVTETATGERHTAKIADGPGPLRAEWLRDGVKVTRGADWVITYAFPPTEEE